MLASVIRLSSALHFLSIGICISLGLAYYIYANSWTQLQVSSGPILIIVVAIVVEGILS